MSQSFFLRSINSDLSVGGALFNRQRLEDTAAPASQAVSLSASQTIDGYAWTEPGVPGTDGDAGDYTVSVHVTDGATQINISTRLARVDSDGVVQAEGGFSTPDPGNAGIKVHEFESFSLGTWNEGDRLRVQYRFVNTDSMMARSLTIEKNTVETELITPWEEEAEPDPQTIPVAAVAETEAADAVAATPGVVSIAVAAVAETESAQVVAPAVGGEPQTIPVAAATETEAADAVAAIGSATQIFESWECPDSASIDCQLTWTTIIGNYDLESNQAQSKSAGMRNIAVADTPLASEDMRVTVFTTPTGSNPGTGPVARASDSAQTHYYAQLHLQLQLIRVTRTVDGTNVNLADDIPFTVNASQEYKVSLVVLDEGDDVRVIVEIDDTEIFNLLDTSPITGFSRAGIRTFSDSASFNTFEAADAAAAAATPVQVAAETEAAHGIAATPGVVSIAVDAAAEAESASAVAAAPGVVSIAVDAAAEAESAHVIVPFSGTFDPPDFDVVINGNIAQLTWTASPTPGVVDYLVFRRTPQTGEPFDPAVDTPIADGITDTFYDDEGLSPGEFDWQVFGRVPG